MNTFESLAALGSDEGSDDDTSVSSDGSDVPDIARHAVEIVKPVSKESTYLNDVWSLYFHGSDDPDWTLPSYIRLTDVSTVEDFWASHACIKDNVPDNMFFMMREGVYPCWDDPKNMYGGSISLKVSKADATRAWETVCSRVLGETMLAKDAAGWESVNGVSISPKKYFSILKVWLKDGDHDRPSDFSIPTWYAGEVLYRSHLDCIKANSEKLLVAGTPSGHGAPGANGLPGANGSHAKPMGGAFRR